MSMGLTWVREGRLAASGLAIARNVPHLLDHGIRAVLSLTERNPWPDGPPDGLEQRHVAIPDFTAPSPATLDRALGFLAEMQAEGRPTLVHCMAGYGRTGTVVACWLVAVEGLTADEAIAEIRDLRPYSVETAEQEACVAEFARRIREEAGR
jgi:atypical dual specificity phosphatase